MSESKSKTFCVYPWIQQTLLPPGHVSYCCVARRGGPLRDEQGRLLQVPQVSLNKAWNSSEMREIRRKMLNGEPIENCHLCYYQESIGKDSYRQMHNREWQDKAGAEIERRIEYSKKNEYKLDSGALYLDLRLGNLCNLKCRMCNPSNSSKIAAETERLLQTDDNFRDVYGKTFGKTVPKIPKWFDEPSFWEGVYAELPSLRKVYLTGGEPTLIKKNHEFLKHCVETGHSRHIFLMFNINCTNVTDEFLSYLEHFEFVLMNVSLDGFGAVNEYIRGGSDWDLVEKNFERLMRAKGPVQIGVTPTVQVYNILNLVELLEFVQRTSEHYRRQVNMDFLYVTHPAFLDIRILPESIKKDAYDRLVQYRMSSDKYLDRSPNLKNALDSVLNALGLHKEDASAQMADFVQYTRSLDRARNENFNQVLGHLSASLAAEGVHV